MKEADEIYVLDTGSEDQTKEKLEKLGVHVKRQIITPWRFDVARNLSLDMIPLDTDICVCTDLDEVFESGWRDSLEKLWTKGTTRVRYNYNWSFDNQGTPAVNFYIEKIHIRNGYRWTHPVHEVLTYFKNEEKTFTTDAITLNHYPDVTKSRGSYLPLLELSVQESPEDDRNMHYLGREYMYHQKWNECIDTLIKHLNLKTATWKDERSASMRFISRSYKALKRYEEARMWLDKAIQETPYLRDPYVERALLEYTLENDDKVIFYCNEALTIKTHQKTYINETFSWDHTIYDLLSIAYFHKGKLNLSLDNINLALKISPKDKRLIENKKIIEKSLKVKND